MGKIENNIVDSGNEKKILHENVHYRCLEYHQRQTDDIYMTLCGIEKAGSFKTDGRPNYHLHVVLSGKGTLYLENEKFNIRHGQMFITKPGEKCWYECNADDPWKYCWMTFGGNKAEDYVESMGFKKGIYVRDCNEEPYKFFDLVKKILDRPELTLARDLMRLSILLEYIGLAIESNYKMGQSSRHQHDYSPEAYVDHALDFIHYNYRTIKVSDVSKYVGINRSYMANIFKAKMGISPQEYLVQYRLKEAARLLRETNQPIQDISHKVGYNDPLTFSKMFKNFYGMSPRTYRAKNEEKYI